MERGYLVLLEELLENVAGVDPVVEGKDGVHLSVSLEKRNICKESKRLALNEIFHSHVIIPKASKGIKLIVEISLNQKQDNRDL